MNEINIFADSLCDIYEYFDENFEKGICVNTSKVLNFFINKHEVFNNSCLINLEYSAIFVNLIMCNDLQIKDVNEKYRKINRPTDVISFALFADSAPSERFVFDGEINLGDIFISLETTKRQAAENDVSFEYEFYYLISHSLLHLLGFDHQDNMSYDFMVKMQEQATEYINV